MMAVEICGCDKWDKTTRCKSKQAKVRGGYLERQGGGNTFQNTSDLDVCYTGGKKPWQRQGN